MKIVDRLKRWFGVDRLEDAVLLNRYGARDMDELYVMILMGRTVEAGAQLRGWQHLLLAGPFMRASLVTEHQIALYKQYGLRANVKRKEEVARANYKTSVRERQWAISRWTVTRTTNTTSLNSPG